MGTSTLRAHYHDIVNDGREFMEKLKGIENDTYSLKGWLWKIKVNKQVKRSEKQREIYIMHRGGLFIYGSSQLEKPTL
jgi:hypothetical protein